METEATKVHHLQVFGEICWQIQRNSVKWVWNDNHRLAWRIMLLIESVGKCLWESLDSGFITTILITQRDSAMLHLLALSCKILQNINNALYKKSMLIATWEIWSNNARRIVLLPEINYNDTNIVLSITHLQRNTHNYWLKESRYYEQQLY